MNTFVLNLQSLNCDIQIEGVQSFIATDMSGRFGLQAKHEDFVTILSAGLARYRDNKKNWHYIAQPGASLVFENNSLTLSSTQFIVSDKRDEILAAMDKAWAALDEDKASTKRNIAHVEQAMTRKLIEMNQGRDGL